MCRLDNVMLVLVAGIFLLSGSICTSSATEITAGTVIVTDTLDSSVDLSWDKDIDPSNDRELVIQWNFPDYEAKDVHVYVLANESGKMKYLGRATNGETNYFRWYQGNIRVAEDFEDGPKNGSLYRFYIFLLPKTADYKRTGPIGTAGPVEFLTEGSTETPEVPKNSVIVTDDILSYEDLSNDQDVDYINDRELVIRWNYTKDNVKDVHIYMFVDDEKILRYLGRTASGQASFFQWKEGAANLSPAYNQGPEGNHSYRFVIFMIKEKGLFSFFGPYFNAGPVEYLVDETVPTPTETWSPTPTFTATSTPTPTQTPTPGIPTLINCVIPGDFYANPVSGLSSVVLDGVTIDEAFDAEGTPVPLNLIADELDGNVVVEILGSTETASIPASISFAADICPASGPKTVTLYAHSSEDARFLAYDDQGEEVDVATLSGDNGTTITNSLPTGVNAALSISVADNLTTSVQPVVLRSESGIRMINVDGDQIHLQKVCWDCNVVGEPAIPDRTAIVTDDLYSYVDLSNGQDVDTSTRSELVVRWRIDDYVAKDYHVYVQVNGSSKKYYLGRAGGGSVNYFRWAADARYVDGKFKEGPQSLYYYQFFVYAIPPNSNTKKVGPIGTAGPVIFLINDEGTPEPTPVIPNNSVIVTDDLLSYTDLSNGEDQDPVDQRELVVRWRFDDKEAKDFHIYILINETGKYKYLGRTNDGYASSFRWSRDNRYVTSDYKSGPVPGNSYRFFVFVLNETGKKKVDGPFSTVGPVLYLAENETAAETPTPNSPTATPTATPTQTPTPDPSITPEPEEYEVSVTDTTKTYADLSNGQDIDDDDNVELVIRWTEDLAEDAKQIKIYVQTDGSGEPSFMATVDKPSSQNYRWNDDSDDIDEDYEDGPASGHSYQFFLYVVKQKKNEVVGPYTHAGPVEMLVN